MPKKTQRRKRDRVDSPPPSNRDREQRANGKEKEGAKPSAKDSLWEWIKSLLVAVVLFLFIRTFLLHTFVIISGSMESTLLVGDLLLVNRVAVGSRIPGTSIEIPGYSELKREVVIVFDPPHEEDMKLVKRLIGLPGDTLEMREKDLFLNGGRLDEPYVQHLDLGNGDSTDPRMAWQTQLLLHDQDAASYHPTRDNWGPLVIPEGRYFMLGDSRDSSLDSRYWGLLERWRIEGRAVAIYFSYNKESVRAFPFLREVRWSRIADRIH